MNKKETIKMSDLIGKEIKIGEMEGEITNILGVGYEITFLILIMVKLLLMQDIFIITLCDLKYGFH